MAYLDPDRTAFEAAVEYDGDLLIAASELASLLDDDGLALGTTDFKEAAKALAKEHRVTYKALMARLREIL